MARRDLADALANVARLDRDLEAQERTAKHREVKLLADLQEAKDRIEVCDRCLPAGVGITTSTTN